MVREMGKKQGFFCVGKMFLSISKNKTLPCLLEDVWFLIYFVRSFWFGDYGGFVKFCVANFMEKSDFWSGKWQPCFFPNKLYKDFHRS
jgi:hypothetical protein